MIETLKFHKTIVLAILNFKGGVGKTTTTFNLLAQLAQRGFKVLVIDFDPQASLSSTLDVKAIGTEDDLSSKLLKAENKDNIDDILKESTKILGIDFLPTAKEHGLNTTIKMIQAEGKVNPEVRLRKALKKIKDKKIYDFIIIDCGPGEGMLNKNVLIASNYVISPMEFDNYGPEGIEDVRKVIHVVNDDYEEDTKILGILGNKYDSRTLAHKNIENNIEKGNMNNLMFKTRIRRRTVIEQSVQMGIPIALYDPDSESGLDYKNFTNEVIQRLCTIENK